MGDCALLVKEWSKRGDMRLEFKDFNRMILTKTKSDLRATVTQRDPYEPLKSAKIKILPSDVEAAIANNLEKEAMFLRKLE